MYDLKYQTTINTFLNKYKECPFCKIPCHLGLVYLYTANGNQHGVKTSTDFYFYTKGREKYAKVFIYVEKSIYAYECSTYEFILNLKTSKISGLNANIKNFLMSAPGLGLHISMECKGCVDNGIKEGFTGCIEGTFNFNTNTFDFYRSSDTITIVNKDEAHRLENIYSIEICDYSKWNMNDPYSYTSLEIKHIIDFAELEPNNIKKCLNKLNRILVLL